MLNFFYSLVQSFEQRDIYTYNKIIFKVCLSKRSKNVILLNVFRRVIQCAQEIGYSELGNLVLVDDTSYVKCSYRYYYYYYETGQTMQRIECFSQKILVLFF